MVVTSFSKYQSARQRAKARANEVIDDMRKQAWTQNIDFDAVISPKMREDLENQYYEMEKIGDDI